MTTKEKWMLGGGLAGTLLIIALLARKVKGEQTPNPTDYVELQYCDINGHIGFLYYNQAAQINSGINISLSQWESQMAILLNNGQINQTQYDKMVLLKDQCEQGRRK